MKYAVLVLGIILVGAAAVIFGMYLGSPEHCNRLGFEYNKVVLCRVDPECKVTPDDYTKAIQAERQWHKYCKHFQDG